MLQKWLQRGGFLLLNGVSKPPESENFLCNSLLAGNSSRDRCGQHCVASQAVRRSETLPPVMPRSPSTGGFCDSVDGLWRPDLANGGAKPPECVAAKTSSQSMAYRAERPGFACFGSPPCDRSRTFECGVSRGHRRALREHARPNGLSAKLRPAASPG